jgi:hypothetical protein
MIERQFDWDISGGQSEGIRSPGLNQGLGNVFYIHGAPYSANTSALPSEVSQVKPTQTFSRWKNTETKEKAVAEPTREEIDAKLAVVEARTETRFVELSSKIDRVADSIVSLSGEIRTIKSEVKEDNKLTRWTIIGLGVAGLAALWLTQSNMLASFSAGIAVHEAQKPVAPSTQK